ncbi:MAG: hypothetical protein ACYDH4_11325 [Candidatus Cryosericum sp.]
MSKVRKLRFPSVKDVARELRAINNQFDAGEEDDFGETEGVDVRLQVSEGGAWSVHYGDSSYAQDHRGFWGASSVPGGRKRFNATRDAADLIDQAEDQAAQEGFQLRKRPAKKTKGVGSR